MEELGTQKLAWHCILEGAGDPNREELTVPNSPWPAIDPGTTFNSQERGARRRYYPLSSPRHRIFEVLCDGLPYASAAVLRFKRAPVAVSSANIDSNILDQQHRVRGLEVGHPITADYDANDDLAADLLAIKKGTVKLGRRHSMRPAR
jgi:hypothetical protein